MGICRCGSVVLVVVVNVVIASSQALEELGQVVFFQSSLTIFALSQRQARCTHRSQFADAVVLVVCHNCMRRFAL